MPDAPGPIDVLNPAAFDLSPLPASAAEPPDPLEQELIALEGQLEREVGDLAAVLESDPRAELDSAMLEASEGIQQDVDVGDQYELDGAEEAVPEIEDRLMSSFSEAVDETWQELPAFYAPPPDTTVPPPYVTPEIPEPELPVTPPEPPPPAVIKPQVRMVNLWRPGQINYWVGDHWRVTITGAQPNVQVFVGAYFNGENIGATPFGYTDADGNWSVDGYMLEEHRGSWIEEWWVGGELCEPTLTFFVY